MTTPPKAALDEAFSAEEAKRRADPWAFRYPPPHARGLNLAERAWSVLVGQCLDRGLGDRPTLGRELAAGEKAPNRQRVQINGGFRVADARVKLSQLYPAKSL